MRIDANEARSYYNPIAMHAFYLVDQCGGDLAEARTVAAINLRFGHDPKHWLQIYALLNGEANHA